MAKSKEEDVQTIDITPFLTPLSILLGAVMISVSIFFGTRDFQLGRVSDKTNDVAAASKSSVSSSVSSSSSSGDVAGATSSPVTVLEVSYTGNGAQQKGNDSASIVMLEYTDYECPFCSRHYTDTQGSIESAYVDTGIIKYVTKDFPLSIHENAEISAQAAHCAEEQGKFWEMHDKMFENQDALTSADLKKYAQGFGLNAGQFNDCLDNGKYKDLVSQSLSDGSSVGVTGTPGFFIGEDIGNGKLRGFLIPGAYPYSTFQAIIDAIQEGGIDAAAEKCKETASGIVCTT